MIRVAAINVTPVKGLGLQHPDSVDLTEAGAGANRRFYLRSDGRLFNGKRCGPLVRIQPEVEGGTLALRFPDATVVSDRIGLGEPVETDFWGRPVFGRVVEGPWAAALSAFAGVEVQLVYTDTPGTGIDVHVGSLMGRASCERLAGELGAPIDPRRFRMLLELEGSVAHEEDTWVGRELCIGHALLRVGGPVPRCAVTTQDPDSGEPTLDTLRGIRDYRGLREGKKIDFGVYFDVEEPGRVAVGDAVVLG